MKKIEAIIKPHALSAVVAMLKGTALDEVTVAEVQGMGRHREGRAFYRGAVYVIDTFPKLRIEVAVPDDRVDEVVSILCRVGRTRGMGNGKVLVVTTLDVVPVLP